jgi:glycosyltransferase involved in cell wall biosynthesis
MYNSKKTIFSTLNSIFTQSYRNFEIIIVDDGSTDDSCSLVESYLKSNVCRSKIYKIKNSGQSKARDFGFLHVENGYVLFLDSDDIIERDFFQNFIHSIDSSNFIDSEIYLFDYKISYLGNIIDRCQIYPDIQYLDGKTILEDTYLKSIGPTIGTSNIIYSASFLKKYSLKWHIIDQLINTKIDSKFISGDDICFPMVAFLYSSSVTYLPIFSVVYNQHGSNLSYKFDLSRLGAFYSNVFLISKIRLFHSEFNDFDGIINAISRKTLNGFLYNLIYLRKIHTIHHDQSVSYKTLLKLTLTKYPNIISDYKSVMNELSFPSSFKQILNHIVLKIFLLSPTLILSYLSLYFRIRGLKDDFGVELA